MSAVTWGLVAVAAVLAVLAAGWLVASTWTPVDRAARVATESRRLGIEVPTDLEPELGRGAAIRARAVAVGILVGSAAGIGITLVLRPSPQLFDFWVGTLVAAVIIGVSAAVGAALRPRPRGGERVARSRATSFADYLSAWELVPTRVLPFTSLAGGGVALIVARDSDAWLAVAIALIAIGAELVFELAGRRLLAQGQPAREPLELAWDDGIRADALRQMASAARLAGLLGLLAAALALIPGLTPTGIASLGTLVLSGIIISSRALRRLDLPRHYLRRLWPDVPRGAAEVR